MNENLQRIASLFGLPAEPPAVEADGSGVWQCSASTPPVAAGAIAPELVLTAAAAPAMPSGCGCTPAAASATDGAWAIMASSRGCGLAASGGAVALTVEVAAGVVVVPSAREVRSGIRRRY